MNNGALGWRDIKPGAVVTEPGSAAAYKTGDWRSLRPIWDYTRCVKCGMCEIFCPDGCVYKNNKGYFEADLSYCKGCGICARECWTGAITMVEEEK